MLFYRKHIFACFCTLYLIFVACQTWAYPLYGEGECGKAMGESGLNLSFSSGNLKIAVTDPFKDVDSLTTILKEPAIVAVTPVSFSEFVRETIHDTDRQVTDSHDWQMIYFTVRDGERVVGFGQIANDGSLPKDFGLGTTDRVVEVSLHATANMDQSAVNQAMSGMVSMALNNLGAAGVQVQCRNTDAKNIAALESLGFKEIGKIDRIKGYGIARSQFRGAGSDITVKPAPADLMKTPPGEPIDLSPSMLAMAKELDGLRLTDSLPQIKRELIMRRLSAEKELQELSMGELADRIMNHRNGDRSATEIIDEFIKTYGPPRGSGNPPQVHFSENWQRALDDLIDAKNLNDVRKVMAILSKHRSIQDYFERVGLSYEFVLFYNQRKATMTSGSELVYEFLKTNITPQNISTIILHEGDPIPRAPDGFHWAEGAPDTGGEVLDVLIRPKPRPFYLRAGKVNYSLQVVSPDFQEELQ